MSFGDSVKANCNKILQEIDKKCYSIVWQLFTSIVMKTPSPENPGVYATGLMANQWYPQQGSSFSSAFSSATSSNGSGSLARINNLSSAKEFLGKDGSMTMANNDPIAYRAEYVGWPITKGTPWTGRVKPYRMVGISLVEVAAKNR